MDFSGFRPESFEFFAKLSENNNEEWFNANVESYEEFVLEPFRGLVRALDPHLRELSENFGVREEIDEHFSLLERGDRVPPGTPPYKTSFYAFFWDRDFNRLSDGTLYIGLSAEGVSIGFSIYDFGNDPQAKMTRVFKPRLRRHLNYLDEYIKSQYLRRGFDFHRYARAPGRLGMREVDAFPEVGPQWENTLGWVVKRQIHTESSRLTPGSFVAEVKESFERLYPLYVFCCDPREDFRRVVKIPGGGPPPTPTPVPPPREVKKPLSKLVAEAEKAEVEAKKAAAGESVAETPSSAAGKKKSVAKKAKAKKKTAPKKAAAKKKTTPKKKTVKKKAVTKKKTGAKKKVVTKKKVVAKKKVAKKAATKKKAVAKKNAAGKKKTAAKKKAPRKKKAAAKKKPATKKKTTPKKKTAAKKGTRKKAAAKKSRTATKKKAAAKKKSAARKKTRRKAG